MEPLDLLATFAAAMTPIGELRLAIPLAIYTLEIPWYVALPVAIAGNMVPVLLLVPGLNRLSRFLQSFPNPASRLLTNGRLSEFRGCRAAAFRGTATWPLCWLWPYRCR